MAGATDIPREHLNAYMGNQVYSLPDDEIAYQTAFVD